MIEEILLSLKFEINRTEEVIESKMSAESCLRLLAVFLGLVLVVAGQVKSNETTASTRQLNETLLDLAASVLTNLSSDEGSNTTTDMMMMLDQLGTNPDLMPFVNNNLAELMNGMQPDSLGASADLSSNGTEMGNYSNLSKEI